MYQNRKKNIIKIIWGNFSSLAEVRNGVFRVALRCANCTRLTVHAITVFVCRFCYMDVTSTVECVIILLKRLSKRKQPQIFKSANIPVVVKLAYLQSNANFAI